LTSKKLVVKFATFARFHENRTCGSFREVTGNERTNQPTNSRNHNTVDVAVTLLVLDRLHELISIQYTRRTINNFKCTLNTSFWTRGNRSQMVTNVVVVLVVVEVLVYQTFDLLRLSHFTTDRTSHTHW